MYILGLAFWNHDAAACLIKDGEVIAAAEEERFDRIKHSGAFPQRAIAYCLNQAGIEIGQIEHIAYGWDYGQYTLRKTLYGLRYVLNTSNLLRRLPLRYRINKRRELFVTSKLYLPASTRHHTVEHHLAHAASAFYPSGFKEAAVLTVDGMGEWNTTALYYAQDNHFTRLQEIYFPNSLGILYNTFTEYLGFKRDEDEYKVMGLAPYGEPRYLDIFRDIVKLRSQGMFELDLSYLNFHLMTFDGSETGDLFSPKVTKILGPPRFKDDPVEQKHADVAASLQRRLEEVMVHIVNHLYQLTKSKNLCIAGGVGLNSVANGRISRETPFENIFIQPAANDAGTALGAALSVYYNELKGDAPCHFEHAYLGPEYSNEEIERVLIQCKLPFRRLDNPSLEAARRIAEGEIVGWFQGRMEFGPRALGNRSILCDARRPEMKDLVNKAVKYREPFRPFAPAVTLEAAKDYFADCIPSPYMILVTDVLPEKRGVIPAVTHTGGTARLQTVDKKTNHRFYGLLEELGRITGVPVVLNTSFNVRGEPIVCTPSEALRTFYATGLDALVIGDFLVEKRARVEAE